jgi:cytochrome P450
MFPEELRRNPYPMYAQLRGSAPVLHNVQADLFFLFDYDSVKRALTDHESFSSAVVPSGATSQWLMFIDAPRHTKLRALITRAFTPRAVTDLEPRIREISRALLQPLSGEIDLVAEYAVPLPLMVIAEMLGAPAGDYARFRHWSDAILGLIHSVSADEKKAAAEQAFRDVTEEMRGYLSELLASRRREPQEDLLTRLLHAEVEGQRLSEEEILGFFQLLLVAGHETTTNLISNTIVSFAEHPHELQRLRDNPSLLPSAIEEVLRYRSPVQATFRRARRAIELHGQTIEEGKLLLPMMGSANRDPAHFSEPDRFDITRDPNPHIAFGHGLHFCIGAPLSRLEARVAIPDLLARIDKLEIGDWPPREAFHVHGPARLSVRLR